MGALGAATEFARAVANVQTIRQLDEALTRAIQKMGIRYYALSHHVDFSRRPFALRLHNYPSGWEAWYDAQAFGVSDPVHRGCYRRAQGFFWHELPDIIMMTSSDLQLLESGAQAGLGEGITVPLHIQGEARGSCTFVSQAGSPLPDNIFPWAQTVGICAFEGARRLARRHRGQPGQILSERQRQCAALAGGGRKNREIAQLLGIGEQTVIEHFREARQRMGVDN